MIRISTRGRYGTRLMLDLAVNYGRGPILLKEIAGRQEISTGYLEQITPGLKAAGLIDSVRGARGGYMLAREPGSIRLKDILDALEGPVSLAGCVDPSQDCRRAGTCATRDIWDGLSRLIGDYLESITLEQLMERHKHKQQSSPMMYSI